MGVIITDSLTASSEHCGGVSEISFIVKASAEYPRDKDHQSLFLRRLYALDSAVCVISDSDFIHGRCYKPGDMDLAKREGWIWIPGTHNQ